MKILVVDDGFYDEYHWIVSALREFPLKSRHAHIVHGYHSVLAIFDPSYDLVIVIDPKSLRLAKNFATELRQAPGGSEVGILLVMPSVEGVARDPHLIDGYFAVESPISDFYKMVSLVVARSCDRKAMLQNREIHIARENERAQA